MPNILIMGAGGFGAALAVMADRYGHNLTLWSPFEQEVERLARERALPSLLPGVQIPASIAVTSSLAAMPAQDLVILATPSFAVREAARRLEGKLCPHVPVACVAKGLEAETLKPLSLVLEEEISRNPVVILSGPSHAEEVSRGVPTSIVAASRSRAAAEEVQDMLMNDSLRIYVNDDVLGVEYGGALKNVIALAAGVLDGTGGGDNTKAALMTRGIAEIARLGVALGAKVETFAGLSGIGDLIVTCSSMHSRNRRFGMLVGQGIPPEAALRQVGMVVEGYTSTKAAYLLSCRHNIQMPITAETYRVLYENKAPSQAIRDLMDRPKRHESEEIWSHTG